jgi:uncharacterized protein YebE (UPF0316 family)
MTTFFNQLSPQDWYAWVILPVIIFFARICDVTLGTLRIIFVTRGKRKLAPLLGFCEVLIWVVVISQIMRNAHSVTSYLGYAAGFAAGNYIGMYIEDHLALGTVIVRVIIPECGDLLVERLHTAGYGVTSVDGAGANGPVKVIYTLVKRKHLNDALRIIHEIRPKAFVSIEDVRTTLEGVFPATPCPPDGTFAGRLAK